MSNIEERVLSMEFDNSDFEGNVQESMSTLDKLKDALKFTGVEDGFNAISDAAGAVDMGVLGSAVETVSSKFSALEVVAITALANITNKAVNAAESLVKSLTIDQITEGFSKYEQKMEAVQTIMSATTESWEEDAKNMNFSGTQMEYVSENLDKLNWFSDETSYSFTDMTSNIGKFTSAGRSLSESVTAMEGISVWAAKSGQNVESAGRAYYNLAQALSVGAVKLIDWKSIENANMATVEFKQTAIDTAEALGTLKKVKDGVWQTEAGNEVTVTNFNDALKDEWFTADVLMTTLTEYGKATTLLSKYCEENNTATTGLLNTFDDYNDAVANGTDKTEALTKAAEDLGVEADDLGTLFDTLNSEEYELSLAAFRAAQQCKTFKDVLLATKDAVSTQWMNSFEYIFGNYEEAVPFWSELCERMWDVFAAAGDVRNSILELWHDNGGRDAFIQGIWDLWDSLDALNDPLGEALVKNFPKLGTYLQGSHKYVKEISEGLIDLTEKFGKFASEGILKAMPVMEFAGDIFDGFLQAIKGLGNIGSNALSGLSDLFGKMWTKLTSGTDFDWISTGIWVLGADFKTLGEAFNESKNIIPAFWSELGETGELVVDIFKNLTGAIADFFATLTGKSSLGEMFAEWFLDAATFIREGSSDKLVKFFGSIQKALSGINSFIGNLRNGFKDFALSFKNFEGINLSGLATGLGNFFSAIIGFFKDSSGNIGNLIQQLANSLGSLFDVLGDAISKLDLGTVLDTFLKLGAAGILMKIVKGFESLKMAIKGMDLGNFFGAIKMGLGDIQEFGYGEQLLKIAEAVAVFCAALWLLSSVPLDDLSAAAGILGAVIGATILMINKMTELEGVKASIGGWADTGEGLLGMLKALATDGVRSIKVFLKCLSGVLTTVGIAVALLVVAVAVKVLASAMQDFADVEWENVGKGLSAMAGLAAIITLMERFGADSWSQLFAASSLKKAAEGMKSLAEGLQAISSVSWGDLAKAGAAEAGLAVIIWLMDKFGTDSFAQLFAAGSLNLAGQGIKALGEGLKAFEDINWGELAKAGSAEAGLGVIIGCLSRFGGGEIAQICSSGALDAAALGIKTLGEGVKTFSEIDFDAILSMTTAESAIMLIIGLISKYVGGLQALGGGVGLAAAGASIWPLAKGLQMMAEVDWDSMEKAGDAVSFMSVIVAILGKVAGMKGLLAGGAIFLASAGLTALAVACKLFMGIEWNEMGILGMIAAIGGLVAACSALSLIAGEVALGAAVLTLLGVAAAAAGAGCWVLAWGLEKVWELVTMVVSDIWSALTELCNLFGSCFDLIFEAIGKIDWSGAWDGIKDAFSSLWDWLSGLADKIDGWLTKNLFEPLKNAGSKIKEAWNDLWGKSDSGDDMTTTETVEFSAEAIAAMEELKTKASEAQQAVRDIGTELLTLDEQFATFGSSTQAIATSMMDITNYCNLGIVALTNLGQQGSFAGQLLVAGLAAGVSQCGAVLMLLPSQGASAMAIFNTTIAAGVTETGTQLNRMGPLAAAAIAKFIAALNSGAAKAYTAGASMGLAAVRGITATASSSAAYQCGANVGQGLINGLNSKATAAYLAGVNLGSAAIRGTNAGSGTASPSKLTFQTGIWDGEGLVNGMKAMEKKVHNAGYNLGQVSTSAINESVKGVGDTISNVNPTITPVLDLSNVNSGLDGLSGRTLNLSGVAAAAAGLLQNGGSSAGGYSNTDNSQVINFYQTNNSPKALSRTAIYRQTKNQLNRIRK